MATKQELSTKPSGEAIPPAAQPASQDVPGFPLMDLWAKMDRAVHDFAEVWQMPTLTRNMWDMAPFWTPMWSRGDVNVCFEVAETDDAVELSAELPGLEEKDVELTDSEIEEYYNNNEPQFTEPEKVRVGRIYIPYEGKEMRSSYRPNCRASRKRTWS